jgi:hypothetical protein
VRTYHLKSFHRQNGINFPKCGSGHKDAHLLSSSTPSMITENKLEPLFENSAAPIK